MNYKASILSMTFSLIFIANSIAQDSLNEKNTSDNYKNSLLKLNFEIPAGWISITSKEEFERIDLTDERLDLGVYNSIPIIELRKDKKETIPSIRFFVKIIPEELTEKFLQLSPIELLKAMSPMSNPEPTINSVSLKKYEVSYIISESEKEKHIRGMILSTDCFYQIYITYAKTDTTCTEQELERIFKSFDIE